MSRADQLTRAKMLLHEAINLASAAMPNSHVVAEARFHMKQAMKKIDGLAESEMKKKKTMSQTQFQDWWGNVVSGTTEASYAQMTPDAKNRILSQLDSMIAEETKKLEELDKTQAIDGSRGGDSFLISD